MAPERNHGAVRMVRHMAGAANGGRIRGIRVPLLRMEVMRAADDAGPGGEGQQGAGDHGQCEEVEGFHNIMFRLSV